MQAFLYIFINTLINLDIVLQQSINTVHYIILAMF
jgi:hypothetical protein